MSRKRSETLGARTTPVTKRLVRMAAEEQGQSVSAWADRALHREALRQLDRGDGNGQRERDHDQD